MLAKLEIVVKMGTSPLTMLFTKQAIVIGKTIWQRMRVKNRKLPIRFVSMDFMADLIS